MIFQTYQTFQEFNETGLVGLLTYPAEVVSIFIPMFLFSVFVIVMLAVYFGKKRTTGRGDFPVAFAVGGYVTTILTFILGTIKGLVNIYIMTVVVAVTIIATLVLVISKRY